MKEVLNISDRITVLRRGKKVYIGPTGELTARELAREMIGEEINEVERSESASVENASSDAVLHLSNLTVLGSRDEIAVSDVSMATQRGEIVGIAGVDGNGQRELAEAIMDYVPPSPEQSVSWVPIRKGQGSATARSRLYS